VPLRTAPVVGRLGDRPGRRRARPRPSPAADQGGGGQGVRAHRLDAVGGVATVELDDLLALPADTGTFGVGVGPAGVAVVMGTYDGPKEVVWSGEGIRWSRQELPEAEPGTKDAVNGITVTPDAIEVRLDVRDE